MTVEASSTFGVSAEVLSPPATTVEASSESSTTVVEVYDGAAGAAVEVHSVAVGVPGPPGLSFIVVAPGQDPPDGTPDRTFVFEGPL